MQTFSFEVERIELPDLFEEVLIVLMEHAEKGNIPKWQSFDVYKTEKVYPLEQHWVNLHWGDIKNPGPVVASVYVFMDSNEQAGVEVGWKDMDACMVLETVLITAHNDLSGKFVYWMAGKDGQNALPGSYLYSQQSLLNSFTDEELASIDWAFEAGRILESLDAKDMEWLEKVAPYKLVKEAR